MDVLAFRVAARFQRRGGIFQAPPGMLEDIYAWVLAVVAANGIRDAKEALNRLSEGKQERSDKYDTLLKSIDALEASPTNWKAYSAVYENLWIFGHPGARWSVKEFQKLTPEKKAALTERVKKLCAWARERVEGDQAYNVDSQKKLRAEKEGEVARLSQYRQPGVEAMTGPEVRHEFEIDLRGWKYGQQELQDRLIEKYKEHAGKLRTRILEKLEESKGADEFARDFAETLLKRMETGEGAWKTITVVLSTAEAKGYNAFWQPAIRMIKVSLPYGTKPYDLENLRGLLRHELQHFAQDFLDHAVHGEYHIHEPGETRPGLPSKKIITPEFKQHLDPKHPSYKKDDPEAVKLRRHLQDQGIDTRLINFHDLDDIEFYTVLADSIDEFKRIWDRMKGQGDIATAIKLFTNAIPYPRSGHTTDTEVWNEQMKALGGYNFVKNFEPSRFFRSLKNHAPGKYQKALKEFVKALG